MPYLTLSLLGPPKISIDGVLIKLPTARAIPLLAYLSMTGTGHPREHIANLLWSDSNLTQGLAALRTTLWRLKSAGLGDWLCLDNNEISLNYKKNIEVDVLEFRAKIDKCKTHGHPLSQVCLFCVPALSEAADLYHGDFIAGITLPKAQIFDEWRMQEGETLHELYIDVLERLTRGHRTLGDFNLAIQSARLLLREDRYNETAQYDLMQLYSITGQRATAINQYKRYKDFLSRELGLHPSEEVTNLYKQILSGRDTSLAAQKEKTTIFLVADIDNASTLWDQAGDKKAEYLSTYHNIFRDTAKRFGGHVLQKSEENITLLFEAGQPLHCAVTIHLKIKKADWGPAGFPIVRMVLYSSIPDDDAEKDFSLVTRKASHLLSMTWGGQITFTEKTLQMIDQPSGSRVRDLGLYRLQDLKEPVHVYEFLHPHVPIYEHRTLRSGNPHSVNFPILTPAFVGREAELTELTALIEPSESRIITLVGPGGAGKTRLAIQFALTAANRFSDGVYFISLTSIQNPELIPIALGDALKFSFFGTSDHTDQLISYLHRMKALLVFDNFEHLRIEGAEFLAYLLSGTHFLKILVTSRERLNLLSELAMEVHGLQVPAMDQVENIANYSSVMLFQQNAQKIASTFNPEKNISAIIRICRMVNGLPLGIILASSWVRTLTCQRIAEEIEKDLDFLSSTAPDLPPRHRSLNVVFDNSWKLLSDDEHRIFRRLAIFPGAFSHQAAYTVCYTTPKELSAFVDKSLLMHTDERFEMLDTFRQYTKGKLESSLDEYAIVRKKFMEFYANFCSQKNQELSQSIQRQSLAEMNLEFENIRTAWDWMIESDRWDLVAQTKQSLLTYHVITGNFIQGRELFEHALNKLNYLNDPSLRLLHTSIQQLDAWMLIRNGFITKGLEILLSCLDTFRICNSPWDIVLTQMFIADANRMLGNYQEGKIDIEAALQGFQSGGFYSSNELIAIQANCQALLGAIYIELGDFGQARLNLQTSLATHQRIGTAWGSIQPLLGLGKLAYMQGDFIIARDFYLQAMQTAENIYDQRGLAMIHNNLAAVFEVIANSSESHHHILISLQLCKETGDRRLSAVILNNLAYHQLRYSNNIQEAIHRYQESLQMFSGLGDLRGCSYSYYDISKAYIKVGLKAEAWDYCSRALRTAMTLDSVPLTLHALHGFAHIYANTNDPERALCLCYLIENHPEVEPDTWKRVIVSRSMLEAQIPEEIINLAHVEAESANLNDVIDELLLPRV